MSPSGLEAASHGRACTPGKTGALKLSIRRAVLYSGLAFSVASLGFSLGSWSAQREMALQLAENDAILAMLRENVARGTFGTRQPEVVSASGGASTVVNSELIEEIKRQLQAEMGLTPVQLLRERRDSFVELNAYDNQGKSSYGTAGYLGGGYFITVKHGVVALPERDDRRITSIKLRYKGRDLPATLVDSGDADVEVHSGDWAIVQVREEIDLPPLRIDTNFAFDFAEPIFRLGNDYSKGISLASGYVGQRTSNGLVTALTDGHPGVSGGGVLNQRGDLVGIPVGRMQGDYRFSFILPLRPEMFRKVPEVLAGSAPANLRASN